MRYYHRDIASDGWTLAFFFFFFLSSVYQGSLTNMMVAS